MTYQPPYPPQGPYPNFDYYYQQQPDPLAPAGRAATMLFVLGAIAMVASFCCIGSGVMLPRLLEQPGVAEKMQAVPGMTHDMIRTGLLGSGIASCAFGITFIILGVFVRRGSKGAIITAIVLSILLALFMLLNIAAPFLSGISPRDAGMNACVMFIPLALIVLLISWLFGAMRAADQMMAARYAAQYWQYGQQPQNYTQPPYPNDPMQPPAEAGGPGERPADRPPDRPPPLPPPPQ